MKFRSFASADHGFSVGQAILHPASAPNAEHRPPDNEWIVMVVSPFPTTRQDAEPTVIAPKPLDDSHVVLLNEDGSVSGSQRKSLVHHAHTPLHLAFSLYVFNNDEQVLMTRRALSKSTWPGVWTNSCCGHPTPGESTVDAISRRLEDELGLTVTDLDCVLPKFAYRARDASGIWENEICPVYFGVVEDTSALRATPGEVMETRWTDWDDLVTATGAAPYAFSPWSVAQVSELGRLTP